MKNNNKWRQNKAKRLAKKAKKRSRQVKIRKSSTTLKFEVIRQNCYDNNYYDCFSKVILNNSNDLLKSIEHAKSTIKNIVDQDLPKTRISNREKARKLRKIWVGSMKAIDEEIQCLLPDKYLEPQYYYMVKGLKQKIQFILSDMETVKTNNGKIYLSGVKPIINGRKHDKPFGFHKHALSRLSQRCFDFFGQYVLFDKINISEGLYLERSNDEKYKTYVHSTPAHEDLLKWVGIDNGSIYNFIGYLPILEDAKNYRALTFLPPGFKGTPEGKFLNKPMPEDYGLHDILQTDVVHPGEWLIVVTNIKNVWMGLRLDNNKLYDKLEANKKVRINSNLYVVKKDDDSVHWESN